MSAETAAGRLDLRLAAPAAAAWVTALVLLGGGVRVALVVAGGCTVPAVLGRVLPRGRLRRFRWTIAATFACAAAAALCSAAHLAVLSSGRLGELAAADATARVELVITSDPELGDESGPVWRRGRSVSVRGSLRSLTYAGKASGGRRPVLVLADGRAWASVAPGERVAARAMLRTPRDPGTLAVVLYARSPPRVVADASPAQRVASRLRAGLRDAVAGLPADERGLVPGLVVGDTSQLVPQVKAEFKNTGLTHLLVVSGSNLAIVVGAILAVGRRTGLSVRLLPVVGAVGVIGFVILARPDPSVLRAAVMGGVGLLALGTGRSRRGLPALFAATLALIYIDPSMARSYAFALSVLATFGLLVLVPPWRDRLVRRGWPRWLAESVAVPAAAQLMCAPVIAMLAGRISLVAVLANLAAAPAVAPVTVLGVLATATHPIVPALAGVLGWCAWAPAWWLVHVARVASAVPAASVPWPGGTVGGLLLAVLSAALLLLAPYRTPRRVIAAAGAGALLAGSAVHLTAPAWPPPGWFLVACDVGQGDGLVLNVGHSAGVVIDTGPDPGPMDACLDALHISEVPLLLVTHLDSDHVGGVRGVFRGRTVGAVVTSRLHAPEHGWRLLRSTAARHHLAVGAPAGGQEWRIGPLDLRVLDPPATAIPDEDEPNESALVTRARIDSHTVLLTADADEDSEQRMLYDGVNLRADVLKVPHHGSADFAPAFLAATGSRLAVISVGAHNGYGHPAPSLLAKLHALGMRVERTDRMGAVAVCDSDGHLTVATQHPPTA